MSAHKLFHICMSSQSIQKKSIQNTQKAFTLIEVIVFTAIASFIFVVLVTLSVTIMRQSSISVHKVYATHYANELAEWLRVQKELNWQSFYTKSQERILPGNTVFCVNDRIELSDNLLALGSGAVTPTCGYTGIGTTPPNIFKRTVTFQEETNNNNGVLATIRVEWKESGGVVYFAQTQTLYAPR